jgi:hypothetical protein
MATNVSLSSVKDSGTLDKIDQVRTKFKDEISNIHVWGYQEISRYLDQYEDIRRTYAHLATPGDAISSLMQGREDEGRRKHQNDDIKKIFECWVNIDIYAVRYLYGSSYPPCFEDFYTEILNQIQRCDPYNEGLLHLKTGYHESAFKKYESLKNKVIKHNKMVATYVISSGRDIRKCITQTIRSLQVCGDNEALILNSYYISNVIVHLRNVASDGKVTLNIKSECVNGVDGFTLYSNGGIRLAFGSQPRISRLNTFLEEYSECFTKEYKKILLSLNGITPLLDDFRVDIHSLIPKAKYGHLNGKCEFEEIDSN